MLLEGGKSAIFSSEHVFNKILRVEGKKRVAGEYGESSSSVESRTVVRPTKVSLFPGPLSP